MRSPRDSRGSIVARVASIAAIVSFWAVLYTLVTQERTENAVAGAGQSGAYFERLADHSEGLARALEKLRPRDRGGRVRARILDTMRERERMESWSIGADVDSERLRNALERHFDYLDAAGSVLSNPLSPLRHRLEVRAQRARAAFDSLDYDAGLAGTIRGWDRLLERAERRRERRSNG